MPYLFVTSDTFCGIYILFGHTFSLFSVFWLVYIEASWKIFKFLVRFWIFKTLKSLNYISVKQENGDDCDDFNFDEILWGIKYLFSLYLQYLCFKCKFWLFFTFMIFIYVVIRFKLVLGHLCGKIKELYMSGKTC